MKYIKLTVFLMTTILLISCGNLQDKKNGQKTDSTNNQQYIQMAKKIKIDGLKAELTKLKNGQTEFQFIGITSNGVDCLYFVFENGKFNIEFEAIIEDQLPYINKLKEFSNSNNLKCLMTTYNNKPQYKSDNSAPVLRIETNATLDEINNIGTKIQAEIFNNNKETVYEVVP